MQQIENWKAHRAGGRITITGNDPHSLEPVKVVGVDEIASNGEGKPLATDKDGRVFELL